MTAVRIPVTGSTGSTGSEPYEVVVGRRLTGEPVRPTGSAHTVYAEGRASTGSSTAPSARKAAP